MTALLVACCLLLSFFFSGMEAALANLNWGRIRHLRERGSLGAALLVRFIAHPGRLASLVISGNLLVNSATIILVARCFFLEWGAAAAVLAVLLMAFTLWLYGEMVPKALFERFPNRLAIRFAPLLFVLTLLLWPFVRLADFLTRVVVRTRGGQSASSQERVTREEIKALAGADERGVPLSGEQQNLIARILDTRGALARDVMRPRTEVRTLSIGASAAEGLEAARTSGFARLPVAHASRPEKWSGVRNAYDLLFDTGIGERPAPRLMDSTELPQVLTRLLVAHTPMGFVQDAEGRDIGIITAEDVLRHYLGRADL
ncbi:MAG: DUF21 domain-containing protein [Verrucomicrobiae bacterium]|nr:DUF21 domain-containing protein [Verrucomicrobiae bacterium]